MAQASLRGKNYVTGTLYLYTFEKNFVEFYHSEFSRCGYKPIGDDAIELTLYDKSRYLFCDSFIKKANQNSESIYPRFHAKVTQIEILEHRQGFYKLDIRLDLHYDISFHQTDETRLGRRKCEAELLWIKQQIGESPGINDAPQVQKSKPYEVLKQYCQIYGLNGPQFYFSKERRIHICHCSLVYQDRDIVGFGTGTSREEARNQALAGLLEAIDSAVRV